MPDGTKLGKAKLRGVESDGMILSEDELGSATTTTGIMVLDDDARARARRWPSVLPIADDVLELEITPNRPDCLGVYGVAREVHAVTGAPLGAAAVGRGRGGRRATAPSSDYASVARRGPRAVPALHRARLHGRDDRARRRCG